MTKELISKLEASIEADLDWRHAELAVYREILATLGENEIKRKAMYRAAWALIYAHYEGFCKYCLEGYIEFLSSAMQDCVGFSDRMFVFMIEKEIKKARSLSSDGIYAFYANDIPKIRVSAPPKIGIETNSNLWPTLLRSILDRLELGSYSIILDEAKIKTLVARRNDIAHGKKVFIEDLRYYLEYERAASNLMYSLALAIVDRAATCTGQPRSSVARRP
ncbi:MAE_28990/MAE_18760 family HEPN-like nuclease [Methylocystis parvus]|uniref:MAE_28990/MAE_18760 family HEPN-like nuclease n=1 Tax=Methylocystis parvus TaxID=134 RepID=UPI003C782088